MLLKNQKYLVVGGITMDVICLADIKKVNLNNSKTSDKGIYIKFSSKTPLKDFKLDFGGSAANSAVALSRVGNKVDLLSCVGTDYFGYASIKNIKDFGVSTKLVKRKGQKTGFGIAIITPDGEKSVLVYRGSNDNLSINDISEKEIIGVDAVFITSMVSKENFVLFKRVLSICNKNNKTVIFAPSISMIRDYKKEIKKLESFFDISIMNIEEARYYTSKFDIKDVIKDLPGIVRVVSADVDGAYAYDGDRILKIGIVPLKVIDSTGAGDTFSACFCSEFLKTNSIERALGFATMCASLKVNHIGARFNKSLREVEFAYKKYKRYLKVKGLL